MKKAVNNYRLTLPLLVIKLITLVLPTVFTVGFALIQFTQSYSGLYMQPLQLTTWFTISLTIAFLIFIYQARFIIFTPLLFLLLWFIKQGISHAPGEFDVFVATARFELNAVMAVLGWLSGFALARSRYFIPLIGALLLTTAIVSLSRTTDLSINYWLLHLLPIVAWVLYMLFMAPRLQNMLDVTPRRIAALAIRTVIFLGSVFFIFWLIARLQEPALEARKGEIEQRNNADKDGKDGSGKEGGKSNYNEKKGLMKRRYVRLDRNGKPLQPKEDDNGYQLKDTMAISDRMSQNDYVMFCSKLDNFFPDGSPKPLYYAFQHLTKYDAAKEMFMRDTAMPSNDELNIDPTEIPLYKTKVDSSIITKTKATKRRNIIEAEVYMTNNVWRHSLLAPEGAFSVQPISIDKIFDTIFTSAYRVKSYATTLTTTYAMERYQYKPYIIDQIQKSYQELNTAKDYKQTEDDFLTYYTTYPQGSLYDSIRALALSITKKATTPLEKIDAIDQYFRSKDANGDPLYRYTLRPGKTSDPNIPTGSMLRTFLFRSHAGYCTYYAGATILFLRAVGVPCRFTTGFATFDRSDKNKGWYWFYGRQAHAWTQVYFEGFGWIDFDTTVGNGDMTGAPKPDGTPPVPPPNEFLAIRGVSLTNGDKKSMQAKFRDLTWKNKDYTLENSIEWTFDLSICRVKYGKKDTTLAVLQPGDSVVIITHANPAKKIPAFRERVKIDEQWRSFPNPISADELHIQPRPEQEKDKKPDLSKEKQKKKDDLTAEQLIWWTVGIFGGLVLLLLLTPLLCWLVLRLLIAISSKEKNKIERIYRFALFTFHQTLVERGSETPLVYAQEKVDSISQSNFGSFMHIYHKLKYTQQPLTPDDRAVVHNFYPAFIKNSKHRVGGNLKWWLRLFNLARAQRFLRRPYSSDEPI